MPVFSNVARRDQAIAEVDALQSELETWFQDWTEADRNEDGSPRGQYQTQLKAVHSEVSGAVKILRDDLLNLDLSQNAGDFYSGCARGERQVMWLWRVWYYFRDKFEQRKDERFKDVLRAADEVVWSCYRPFYQLAPTTSIPQPAPLPYIEPDFSPSVLRRDQRQVLPRREIDFTLVSEAFAELPVPVLKLPITAVNNPWALVLIGHEVGHVVEPLVAEDFTGVFRDTIQSAVGKCEGTEEDQETWGGWADEIFADFYCIMTMGQWAVWAMAQFETAEETFMTGRRFVYPAPMVRLTLMAELAELCGLTVDIPPLPTRPSVEVQSDLRYVKSVAKSIVCMSKMKELVATLPCEPSKYHGKRVNRASGEVEQWSQHLLEKGAAPPSNYVRSARMITAGCAQAWCEVIFAADHAEGTKDLRHRLTQRTLAKIRTSFAPGVRSSSTAPVGKQKPGRALSETLARHREILDYYNAIPR